MTTLASKLKRKMDEEKIKPTVKKVQSSAAGTTLEKVQEREKRSTTAAEAHSSENVETGQMKLDEWKMEKEKLRNKALMTDRVTIEKRIPEEVI